jgi:hypothetical protein
MVFFNGIFLKIASFNGTELIFPCVCVFELDPM